MPIKLITSFRRRSDVELMALVGLIIASLTGNPRFPVPWPAPAPALAQLIEAFEAYCAAYRAALMRDLVRIAERNAAREALEAMLQQLAAYLEFVAHGDEAALRSTGFDLRREPVRTDRSVPPAAPEGVRIQRGAMSGEINLRFGSVSGAGGYEIQVAYGDPTVEANWRQVLLSTTCSGLTLHNLPPLQNCWVRVRGFAGQTFGPWSVPCCIMVL
jgi:hypothetical protein